MLFGKSISPLGEIGKVVIYLIKASATPLLFFVILHAILTADISGRLGSRMLFVVAINAICALTIGIFISKFFRAGEGLSEIYRSLSPVDAMPNYMGQKINILSSLKVFFPESLLKPFVDNHLIGVIMIALALGFSLKKTLRSLGEADLGLMDRCAKFLAIAIKVFEAILSWLVHFVPLAVFGVVAKTVGEFGFSPLKGLLGYLGVGVLGLTLHVVLVYQSWLLIKKVPLGWFWKRVRPTLVYAFGVNSSLATLPMTLKKLDELNVSKKASSLGACVGTNFNNDGILLYEGMAVFFVAQAAGIDLNIYTQLLVAFVCVLGTIGIAGVPEAGFVTLSLVLTTVGLPTEIVPMLLAVDWILGRCRTVVNVLGDMTVSIAIDDTKVR